jgi:hypothetical protein
LSKSAKTTRPWEKCRGDAKGGLLEPGYAGFLDDEELAYIQEKLRDDTSLRLWWGMRPSWKRIPEEVVRRVAMDGDPDNQAYNRTLARPRQPSRAAA